jgi:hypothetical protein
MSAEQKNEHSSRRMQSVRNLANNGQHYSASAGSDPSTAYQHIDTIIKESSFENVAQ